MEKSLIAAFKSMLTLQRWNLHPRVETWVEAENAALTAHWAYVIAKTKKEPIGDDIIHVLFRALLKSLNKHFMTDISFFVTQDLKKNHQSTWVQVVDECAGETAKFFPRGIINIVSGYLTDKGGYSKDDPGYKNESVRTEIDKDRKKEIEDIIRFCQRRVAYQECKTNRAVYGEIYASIVNSLRVELGKVEASDTDKAKGLEPILLPTTLEHYNDIIGKEEYQEYFQAIIRLKYIRRWNTMSRFIPSSVLAHTYIVAVLALMFSLSEDRTENKSKFVRDSLLGALFHDVPEAMTGDIITPVKNKFNEKEDKVIEEVEKSLRKDFAKSIPGTIKNEIEPMLDELSNDDVGESVSLVKDCDRLALMLECLYEKESKVKNPEMESTYQKHYQELSNSEWPSVRQFLSVLSDHWLNCGD